MDLKISDMPPMNFLSERLQKVVYLRKKEKRTFRYISDSLGVSVTRAGQLYHQALKNIEQHETMKDDLLMALPAITRNCLRRQNLTKKSKIIEAIQNGELHPKKTRNYGWINHIRVCRLVGLPDPMK